MLGTIMFAISLIAVIWLASVAYRFFSHGSKLSSIPRFNRKLCGTAFPAMLIAQPDGFVKERLASLDDNGNIMPISYWGVFADLTHVVSIADPEALKYILQNDQLFVKQRFINRGAAAIIGDGVGTSWGELWRKSRKAMIPIFHLNAVKNMIPNVIVTTKQCLEKLKTTVSNKSVEVCPIMAELISSVVTQVVFGDNFESETIRKRWKDINDNILVIAMIQGIVGRAYKFLPIPIVQHFRSSMASIGKDLKNVIQTRRKSGDFHGTDMLSLLLKSTKELEETTGDAISDEQMVTEMIHLLLAAQDTTSSSLSWVCYHIATHSAIQSRIKQEVDSVLKDDNNQRRDIKEEDIKELKYVKAVLLESMRVKNPAPMLVRQNQSDTTLCGYLIPKGTTILVNASSLQLTPDLWEDPSVFRPDRFLTQPKTETNNDDVSKSGANKPLSVKYLPFSSGPRNCMGQNLAMQELTVILAMIIQNFSIKCQDDAKFKVCYKATSLPVGLHLTFEPRS